VSGKAFDELFNELAPQLHAYAKRMTLSEHDAEDIVNVAMVSIFRAIKEGRVSPEHFRAYAVRVLKNVAIDHMRQRRRHSHGGSSELDHLSQESDSPSETLIAKEDALALSRIIAELPENYRKAIQMRFIDGLSIKEIASVLKLSENAVKTQTSRALQLVRNTMAHPPETKKQEMKPAHKQTRLQPQETTQLSTSPPAFVIVWDPEAVTEAEYAALVSALGDLVRAEGGLGIERIGSQSYGVPVPQGSLV